MRGSDYVVCMLGDAAMQSRDLINTLFVRNQLIPSMRRSGVERFLYQAGALSRPYKEYMPPFLGTLRRVAFKYAGMYPLSSIPEAYVACLMPYFVFTLWQHADNEVVEKYLQEEASDIEWNVHRSGIGSEGSKGVLRRSPNAENKFSIATFRDVAAYNLTTAQDGKAVRTSCLSCYV